MSKITDEQRGFLDSFTCERLTKNPANQDLIRGFQNQKGNSLVKHLQKMAWDEDESKRTAYYLVKSSEGKIALYFSLRCGALFEPLDKAVQRSEHFKMFLEHPDFNDEAVMEDIMNYLMEKDGDVSFEDMEELISKISTAKSELQSSLERVKQDAKFENNINIGHVSRNFGGIEIAQFCKNDAFSEMWREYQKRYNIIHSVGSVLFWDKIAPILIQLREIVGCEYVFLFAADQTEEQPLINYYTYRLQFNKLDQVGTQKPIYDLLCLFMAQKMEDLQANRDRFFADFNHDEDDEDFMSDYYD